MSYNNYNDDGDDYNQNGAEFYRPQYPVYPYTADNAVYGGAQRVRQPKKALSLALAALICAGSSGVAAYSVTNRLLAEQAAQVELLLAGYAAQGYAAQAGSETSIAAVVAAVQDTVVEVTTEAVQNTPFGPRTSSGAGSGVIISADGYIVTNYHVVDGATAVTVRTHDGTSYSATVVGTDETTDLAVLKIEGEGLHAATFGDSAQINVGEQVIAIGNPLGELGGTVTDGIISGLNRTLEVGGQSMSLMQTSAAVSPGNSGGGLFDTAGRLVGIVNAKSSGGGVEGLGFAIPVNVVSEVVADLMSHGYVTGRPYMGISVMEVSDEYTRMMLRLNKNGLYVSAVAFENGLKAADRIVSINGAEVSTAAELAAALSSHKAGDTVTVTVERDGELMNVDVTLREAVPAGQSGAQSS